MDTLPNMPSMGTEPQQKIVYVKPPAFDTAIFIDLENLLCGYALTDKETEALDLRGILTQVRSLDHLVGRVAIGRAYANWQSYKTRPLHAVMNELNISQEHVQAVNVSQKNLADIALCTDVMDVLHTRPNIKTFVIVSGDGGFAWMVRRLNEYGKNVVVAAYESQTNKVLKDLADEFFGITDPRGPRVETFKSADVVAEQLLNIFGQFDATRTSLLELQDHVRLIFARLPEIETTRHLLEAGITLPKLQIWFTELIKGFDFHTLFGAVKFIDFVKQYASGINEYVLIQHGSENRLHFRTEAAPTPANNVREKVDISNEKKGLNASQKADLGSYDAIKDSKEAIALIGKIMESFIDGGHYNFAEGVSINIIIDEIKRMLPTLRPYALGANGYEQLIAQVLTRHDLKLMSPSIVGNSADMIMFEESTKRGFKKTVLPPINDVHSVANYRNAMADQEMTKWFFVVQSPELVKVVAELIVSKRKDSNLLSDWVKLAMEKLADKSAVSKLGIKAKTEVQNIFLAFNAAGMFDKFPDTGILSSQKLSLKADILSATKIVEQLRAQCAVKIEKVMNEAPNAEILKQITG
jgi:uncharacterized LabA/DUF88 family protein